MVHYLTFRQIERTGLPASGASPLKYIRNEAAASIQIKSDVNFPVCLLP